jgi:hypothetical protein
MNNDCIEEVVGRFTRRIMFTTAWNRKSEDPNKNYGIGAVHIMFGLIGDKGAITADFFTDWYLKNDQPGVDRHNANGRGLPVINRLGSVDAHAYTPLYEDQFRSRDECCWLNGAPCYMDGSALQGGELLEMFIEHGLDALWVKMEEYYENWLNKDETDVAVGAD